MVPKMEKQNSVETKVLLVGPFPPPLGGTRISFQLLVSYLSNDEFISFKKIDLAHNKNPARNALLQLVILFRILINIPKFDILSFHANPKRILLWGPLLSLFAKIRKTKVQYRFLEVIWTLCWIQIVFSNFSFQLFQVLIRFYCKPKG